MTRSFFALAGSDAFSTDFDSSDDSFVVSTGTSSTDVSSWASGFSAVARFSISATEASISVLARYKKSIDQQRIFEVRSSASANLRFVLVLSAISTGAFSVVAAAAISSVVMAQQKIVKKRDVRPLQRESSTTQMTPVADSRPWLVMKFGGTSGIILIILDILIS